VTTPIAPAGFSSIPSIATELTTPSIGGGAASGAPSFESRIGDAIGEVQRLQDNSISASEGYMRGDHQDVHGTMIAMQEADVSLRLMSSVRNRAIEAYREVMRMGS
jgi:flagellar hook-basal body complex protein FliE